MMTPSTDPADSGRFAAFGHAAFQRYWLARFSATFAVQIVMVAIDERSAARFDGSATPDYGITNWENLFQDPSKLAGDLQTLESGLVRSGITYQVFNSVIPIEGAKWSR
jgi:uncharacterized protein (TIGR02599 family)